MCEQSYMASNKLCLAIVDERIFTELNLVFFIFAPWSEYQKPVCVAFLSKTMYLKVPTDSLKSDGNRTEHCLNWNY